MTTEDHSEHEDPGGQDDTDRTDEPESTRTAWYFAVAALLLFPLALGALWFGWRALRSGNRWGWAPMAFSLLGPTTLIVLTASGSGG